VLNHRDAVRSDRDAHVVGGLMDLLPTASLGGRRDEQPGRPHGQAKRGERDQRDNLK